MPHQPHPTSFRWRQWQQSVIGQKYLTPEGASSGYTVLYVPTGLHGTFLDLADLLQARAVFERKLPQLTTNPDALRELPRVEGTWREWRSWTRKLTAYLTRMSTDRPGTPPPCPPQLLTMDHMPDAH